MRKWVISWPYQLFNLLLANVRWKLQLSHLIVVQSWFYITLFLPLSYCDLSHSVCDFFLVLFGHLNENFQRLVASICSLYSPFATHSHGCSGPWIWLQIPHCHWKSINIPKIELFPSKTVNFLSSELKTWESW